MFKELFIESTEKNGTGDLLNESYLNLVTKKEREPYLEEVFEKLQKAYAPIGGLKGSGFRSPQDMYNLPLWKLFKYNGEIVAGIMYKDKDYRKTVAVFTDGSKKGKQKLTEMLEADFKRSVVELSLSLLRYCERNLGSLLNKYAITADDAAKILGKKIHKIDKYYYTREIGGEQLKKRMVGSINKFK